MEKKFIQSILFSTTVLVVYGMVSPPLQLSAEGNHAFNESARVRKGVIVDIHPATQEYIVSFDGVSVPVLINASTTMTASNGTGAEFSFFRDGSSIYVFGNYDKETRSIDAEKIVMRNRSPMERKTLSRADMRMLKKEGNGTESSSFEGLTLQAR